MNIEATFHKAIKRFMSKRQQGFTMDAFRTVMRMLNDAGQADALYQLRRYGSPDIRLGGILEAVAELNDDLAHDRARSCIGERIGELRKQVDDVAHTLGFLPAITAEMVREAEAHFPAGQFPPGNAYPRWEWYADFYNNAMRNPGVPCPCCNVTPAGDICDHLPSPTIPELFAQAQKEAEEICLCEYAKPGAGPNKECDCQKGESQ